MKRFDPIRKFHHKFVEQNEFYYFIFCILTTQTVTHKKCGVDRTPQEMAWQIRTRIGGLCNRDNCISCLFTAFTRGVYSTQSTTCNVIGMSLSRIAHVVYYKLILSLFSEDHISYSIICCVF